MNYQFYFSVNIVVPMLLRPDVIGRDFLQLDSDLVPNCSGYGEFCYTFTPEELSLL